MRHNYSKPSFSAQPHQTTYPLERPLRLPGLKDPPDEAHVRRRHAPLLQLRLADPLFARSIHSLQYRCGPIRPLPREDVSPEMAVSRRVAVTPALGMHKPEIPDQRVRTEVEDLATQDHPLQLLVRHAVIRAEGLHANGNRLVNADGIGNLNPSNRNQKTAKIRSLPRLTVL